MNKIINKQESFYGKVKSYAKNALIAYLIVGNIVGCTDYLAGFTIGHVSADIATGRRSPTKIEKIVYENWLGMDLSHYPKQK